MPLVLFFTSSLMAFIGGHMLNYTAIMYSLDAFNSSMISGIAFFFCFGTSLLFGWFAGAAIDRYSAKRVLLLSQNLHIVGAIGFWLVLQQQGSLSGNLYALLISCFITGIGWAFIAPARMTQMAQYLPVERLPQGAIIYNLLLMIGFGLAPLLITQLKQYLGWSGVIEVSLVLIIGSFLLMLSAPNVFERKAHQHLLQEWRECFQQLKAQPTSTQFLLSAMVCLIIVGPMQVILPVIASQYLALDQTQVGQYMGLVALGLIFGGLAAIKLKTRVHIGNFILCALLLSSIGMMTVGQVNDLFWNSLLLLITIIMAGIASSFIVAGIQQQTPIAIKGRVMSMYTINNQSMPALSGALAGALTHQFDPGIGLLIMGGIMLLATLLLASAGQQLRRFKRFL